MQKSKRSSFNSNTKNHNHTKSKPPSKSPSKKNSKSTISHIKNNKIRFSNEKIKKLILIQRNWRIYFKHKIKNKIIKIQSVFRSYFIRQLFNEVFILNKKLECFLFIIKITMFRHAMNYDYLSNKRIDYYSDHKNTKHFLLLQRRIRYYLFMKKIKILEKLGIFNNIYIKTKEYRTKIKSKMTEDKYLAKPIYKYHRPLSQIKMIQRNYLIYAKIMKKINKEKINKLSLNQCPLITKEGKYLNEEMLDDIKNIKNRPINNNKDFYTKVIYNYKPLLLIQQKYKERYNYLKENYKLKKHSKLLRKVNNKHHYIYHSYVVSEIYDVLKIQKNIKYFLYRRHSMVNLVKKMKMKKCEINKKYEVRGNVKKHFYEEFAKRLIIIIRKYFLSYYLKIMRKNQKNSKKKISSFGLNDYNYINSSESKESNNSKRKSVLSSEYVNAQKKRHPKKKQSRKEINNNSVNKAISHSKQSNLINNVESKNYRGRNSKKKVTFKSDTKVGKKENNSSITEEQNQEVIYKSPSRTSKKANKNFSKNKTQTHGSNAKK